MPNFINSFMSCALVFSLYFIFSTSYNGSKTFPWFFAYSLMRFGQLIFSSVPEIDDWRWKACTSTRIIILKYPILVKMTRMKILFLIEFASTIGVYE